MKRLVIALVVLAAIRTARAYPQFQLVKDQTCTSCHLSPAGGGLLSENGLEQAESISQWGTAPEFLNKAFTPPKWLALGGDFRGAGGFFAANGGREPVYFPMQAELYAAATVDAFSVHVTAGLRDPQYQNEARTLFASREHWLQWQQKPGETTGAFVRVGRFMPVFGLRFAEHPIYERRYGGSPLYGETYAAALEYIGEAWEVHATGFIKDPIQTDAIERGNGAALYAETRIAEKTALGVEGKVDVTPDDRHLYGGVTSKQLLSKDFLVEGELMYIHQHVDAGGNQNQLLANVIGSYFVGPFMVDLALGVFHSNLTIALQDREVADLNIHWFATSHVELLLTNRFEMLALGADGLTSGFSLVQLHYRL